jgi:hypothetical protein
MGRQVKRVPVDFNWPVGKVWEGFINPFYKFCDKCKECSGSGYSPEAKNFSDQWYGYSSYGKPYFNASDIGAEPLTIDCPHLRKSVEKKVKWSIFRSKEEGKKEYYTNDGRISYEEAVQREIERMFGLWEHSWSHQLCQADVDALVEAGRLWDFTHRPREGFDLEQAVRDRAYFLWEEAGTPVSDGVEFWNAAYEEYTSRYWLPYPNGYRPTASEINAWSMDGMGHDSCNNYICVKARCEREGVPCLCSSCEGGGDVWNPPSAEQQAEDWQEVEPPTGEAYQVWETVTEGSPMSPAFADPEKLAKWMVENDTSITSDMTFEDWMKFILGDGWAPSMMMTGSHMMSGAKAMVS